MANRQPLDCRSTVINMNDQPVPNLQDIRGWSIWINQQHTSWHRSHSRQCDDARQSTYKLHQNTIRKLITHSLRHCHAKHQSRLLEHDDEHYTYNMSAFNQNCTIDDEPFCQSGELTIPDTNQQCHKNMMPGANPSSSCHDTMPSISPTRHERSTGE